MIRKIDLKFREIKAKAIYKNRNALDLSKTKKGYAAYNNEKDFRNIKQYLSLIRPVTSPSLKLKRIGYKNDDGYLCPH